MTRYSPNGLSLVGYHVAERDLPTRDLWLHPPSTWIPVTLYWSLTQPLTADIQISVSLEDEPGNVWCGKLARAKEVRAFHPPLKWQRAEIVRWDLDVKEASSKELSSASDDQRCIECYDTTST